jgi:hypothetical protein
MPELTVDFIKRKIEYMNEGSVQRQKRMELEKWLFYSGSTSVQISENIRKEFSDPEVLAEMEHRILPYNFMRKIINSLAAVYVEAPSRQASNEDERDQMLLEYYEDSMLMNIRMKEANRMFKLFKKVLAEIYVDERGLPRLRILPAHTYFAFSHSMVSPEQPDTIVKVLTHSNNPGEQRYAFYTDSRFIIVDGKGIVDSIAMERLNNPEGVNPFKVLPFAYIVDSSTSVEPIPDDDILHVCKSIPVLLTDLSFASKYSSYGLLWTVDFDGEIPSGPKAVLHLSSKDGEKSPSVNSLAPDIKISETLEMIEYELNCLLTSRNLKTGTISGKLTADNAASGVAKAIDNSTLNEEQKIDQAYFNQFELEIWEKLSKAMVPVWRSGRKLAQKFNKEFSPDFSVALRLREPKTTLTEMEQIEISRKKLEADPPLSTLNAELSALNPDLTQEEVDMLEQKIRDEMAAGMPLAFSEPQQEEQTEDEQ